MDADKDQAGAGAKPLGKDGRVRSHKHGGRLQKRTSLTVNEKGQSSRLREDPHCVVSHFHVLDTSTEPAKTLRPATDTSRIYRLWAEDKDTLEIRPFCFPTGNWAEAGSDDAFTFLLTGGEGFLNYAFCRRVWVQRYADGTTTAANPPAAAAEAPQRVPEYFTCPWCSKRVVKEFAGKHSQFCPRARRPSRRPGRGRPSTRFQETRGTLWRTTWCTTWPTT